MKNYILTGLGSLVIGLVIGWFVHKPNCPVSIVAESTKIEYRDTCISNSVIANITTETKTVETGDIKKGKTQREESAAPITELTKEDSIYTTVFTKDYNTGLMKMKVTTTVKSKSAATARISMEYTMDTLVLKSLTTVNNVVVVSKDTLDKVPTETVKFLPLETISKTGYIGLGTSLLFNEKPSYDFGLIYDTPKNNFGLFVDPTANLKDFEGVRLQYQRKFFKLSKNK
jgi:hypothetical protein